MGAGGTFPNHSYPNDFNGYHHPYPYQGGYSSPRPISPYVYPPHTGMGYGRGYQRPSYPAPMMRPFQQGGGGFFNSYRSAPGGGLQSFPPSAGPNGNLQMHRPHFDDH